MVSCIDMAPTRLLFSYSCILLSFSCCCESSENNKGTQADILLRDEMVEGDPRCSNHIHKLYRQMRCEPETTPEAKCPTSYNCPAFEGRKKLFCYFDNKDYPLGANLTEDIADFHSPCIQSCQCVKMLDAAGFYCSGVEQNRVTPPGCKRFLFLDDYMCYDRGVTSCSKGQDLRCHYKGMTYREGDRFFPTNDNTCSQCICAAGFNGSITPPYCQQFRCVPELRAEAPVMFTRGCIPVYLGEYGCCPISYRCPRSTDTVIKRNVRPVPESRRGKTCKFGNLTLEIGNRLSPWIVPRSRGLETLCHCRVPPLATCLVRVYLTSEQRWMIAMEEMGET